MKVHSLQKIAILDWDLHHGNGTQHSFYWEKGVLYLSIHQSPCFPGSGMMHETGEGEGEGYTVNLPIPAGTGDEGYLQAFDELFIPIIKAYEPEIILVSAGFDSHELDPLGGMQVTNEGFGMMGQMLMGLADEMCNGKIVFFLEGGYSLEGLKGSVRAVIKNALNKGMSHHGRQAGSLETNRVLERAKSLQKRHWNIK